MVLVAGGGVDVFRRARDEEEEGEHAGAEDGEVLDDVEVGEHAGLAVELAVDVGLGGVGPAPVSGIAAAAVAAEEWLEALRPGRRRPGCRR